MKKIGLILAAQVFAACQSETPPAEIAADEPSPAAALNDIADRYYEWALDRAPERAYFAAIDLDRHDGLFDNSPEALAAAQEIEDAFLAELDARSAAGDIKSTGVDVTP